MKQVNITLQYNPPTKCHYSPLHLPYYQEGATYTSATPLETPLKTFLHDNHNSTKNVVLRME